MSKCYVVRTEIPEKLVVYERFRDRISLINNRAFSKEVRSEAEALDSIKEHATKFLSHRHKIVEIVPCILKVGIFHPSLAKGVFPNRSGGLFNMNFDNEIANVARIRREIDLITHDLEECFDVCSPEESNLDVFGTTFETIIHFACVGIENLLAKVSFDNSASRRRATLHDYRKLNAHMKLHEYEAKLVQYPWLPSFRPFENWKSSHKSLGWFQSYNRLKHDKWSSQKQATMRNAIDSALGYWILFRAVFGDAISTKFFLDGSENFALTSRPSWPIEELYIEPEDGTWRSEVLRPF